MTFLHTRYAARGHFGDKTVRVFFSRPRTEAGRSPVFVLLHGVHGCADMSPENKYGRLAHMLNFQGAISAVVETSRLRRDRETFGDDRDSWAREAFRGKTFAADHADVLEGLSLVHSLFPENDLWIWGFSLGGIHAVIAAGGSSETVLDAENHKAPLPEFPLTGIVTSGSGDRIRPGAKLSLELPILDSMPPESILHEAAQNLSAGYFVSFYGSLDETFSEESCREIFREVPLPEARKVFHVIDGADHPFRHLYGQPSLKPLEMMTEKLAPLLHPGPSGFQSKIF